MIVVNNSGDSRHRLARSSLLLDGAANGGRWIFSAAVVGAAASADEELAQAEQFLDRGVDLGDPFVEHVADGGAPPDTSALDFEYFADVVQVEAEGAGTPDERQQFNVALIVQPIARWGSICRCKQAFGLIDSYRFAGDPGSRSGLPDRQS
jgi:hypothetical protein